MKRLVIKDLLYFEKKTTKDGARSVVNVFTNSNDDYIGVVFILHTKGQYGFIETPFGAVLPQDVLNEVEEYLGEVKDSLNAKKHSIENDAQRFGVELELEYTVDKGEAPTTN